MRSLIAVTVLVLLDIIPLADGAVADLDPTFSSGDGTDGIVTAVLPLPSGQTLVAGLFTTYNGVARRGLARVNADGTIDSAFAPVIEAPATGGVVTLLRDGTGRIYLGGLFTRVGGAERRGLARLEADGALDNTFVPELPTGATVGALALSVDGTALFAGGLLSPASNTVRDNGQAVAKLRVTDGHAAPGFTAPGMSAYDDHPAVYKILPLPDGRVFLAGEFSHVVGGDDHWNLCRLRVDGTLDPSFTLGTPIVWTQVNDIDVDAAGRIYLSGNFIQVGDFTAGCIARLSPGGALDTTFKFPAQVAGQYDRAIVNNLLITSDGWLIAVGDFTKYNGVEAKYIVRTFDDATRDPTFHPNIDQEIVAIEEDSAGRLLIGGYFQAVNNTAARNVARLTRTGDGPIVRTIPSSGTVLAGENLVLGTTVAGAASLQWYHDGILVPGATDNSLAFASANLAEAGAYTLVATNRFGSTTSSAVAVNVLPATPGSRDPAFDAVREPFNTDSALALTSADTWIEARNGSAPKLIRYDANFAKTSTTEIRGFSSFAATNAQTNDSGRVWLSGRFTLVSGAVRGIVRITADGALDPTFDNATYSADRFSVLSDSTVLLLHDRSLDKLTVSGQRDETFPGRPATCYALQSDGRIVCGTDTVYFYPQLALARLNADGSVDPSFVAPTITGLGRRGWQWPITEVHSVAVLSTGEIVATTTPTFAYAQNVRLGADGHLISHYELSAIEGAYASIAGVDSHGGFFLLNLGSLHYVALDGWRLVHDNAVSAYDCWISKSQGVLLKCGVGTGFPASASTYVRVLDSAPGEFRLVNLSGRGVVGSDENALIVGFVTSGASGRTLVRGIGPALKAQGVDDAQADLAVQLYQGGSVLQSNDNWSPTLTPIFQQTGAFALTEGSLDAALAPTLASGIYSAMLQPRSTAGGVGLAEIYDASDNALRLVNVSIRGRVESGEKNLFGGFVISGTSPRWVLIRAIGPSLGAMGVGQPLANPRLALMRGSTPVRENDNWSDDGAGPLVAAASRKVGAFAVPAGSKDAMIYARLSPGLYSAIVSPVDSAPGIALLEIYSLE